jgi:hypothetical protein
MAKTYFKGGQRLDVTTLTITPAAVAGGSAVEQTFVIPTANTVNQVPILPTDIIEVFAPGAVSGVFIASARVTALNTVTLQFANPTAGSITPPAGAYRIIVWATVA